MKGRLSSSEVHRQSLGSETCPAPAPSPPRQTPCLAAGVHQAPPCLARTELFSGSVAPVPTEYKIRGFTHGKGCHSHTENKACRALYLQAHLSPNGFSSLLSIGFFSAKQNSNFKYVEFEITLKTFPDSSHGMKNRTLGSACLPGSWSRVSRAHVPRLPSVLPRSSRCLVHGAGVLGLPGWSPARCLSYIRACASDTAQSGVIARGIRLRCPVRWDKLGFPFAPREDRISV